ncbi:undecaprenyldiphospho-muramoylpentapeptide beta-N-acetylglucosaminyltransferase [Bombilactobacillus thymidiniphilus]|uniref:UDP-N-acetylglucosamine--N-acetylmuramyl-(pentapeptide) pyrophosphoryl-undecaprenol N-acetylglucosamine transferase n=1 Tax=Bombilactobacillus thymidiniphilus TaxID=2923363 RepID=A0ABY4PDK8_9LACO|nr:undecaprenyldiphospho-muramoylpentapeptide beta-N-acetylglucosaminyltransferase [Bombilactobacillus thymidiniphilus]UQS83792.1 undecaprenyldiphospho-muramoylpentapeptide beta-N-acetylglucosaminyltransferase [Bombilactobacillus thymidiniphilus]
MRIIVSGGGTGGHIYPAMALIKRMQERKLIDEVLYVGTAQGLEKKIVHAANIPFAELNIKGFKRSLSLKNFKTLALFVRSVYQAKKIIRDFKPDVVLGTGGYVSSAIVYAAHRCKVPTVIHEQNSVAGLTNKFLGYFVDKIAYVFAAVKEQFQDTDKLVFTGNPRAQEVAGLKPNQRLAAFDLDPDKETVMIFGGSRGAAPINKAAIACLPEFATVDYQVLFVTGKVHYQGVLDQIKAQELTIPDNVRVVAYIDDMPSILPDISLIVGRSGATSIAELTALAIPAIFVPSPYVTHDHQTKNAQALVQQEAARMLTEDQLTATKLFTEINELLQNPNMMQKMRVNSLKLGVSDASDRLIAVLLDLVKPKK